MGIKTTKEEGLKDKDKGKIIYKEKNINISVLPLNHTNL